MRIERVVANGLELAYQITGEGVPLLLVMGIGAQLVHWPDGFVSALASRGFRVVRFDNRDVGESTRLDHLGRPDLRIVLGRALLGRPRARSRTRVSRSSRAWGMASRAPSGTDSPPASPTMRDAPTGDVVCDAGGDLYARRGRA